MQRRRHAQHHRRAAHQGDGAQAAMGQQGSRRGAQGAGGRDQRGGAGQPDQRFVGPGPGAGAETTSPAKHEGRGAARAGGLRHSTQRRRHECAIGGETNQQPGRQHSAGSRTTGAMGQSDGTSDERSGERLHTGLGRGGCLHRWRRDGGDWIDHRVSGIKATQGTF